MKKRSLFLYFAVVCLAAAVHGQAQAQTPVHDAPQSVVGYSEGYVLAAGDATPLFIGRLQRQMPDNVESIYLHDRGFVERGIFNERIVPRPVPPLESYATGDILYDGTLYVGVRMRLDIIRDELVAVPPGNLFIGAVLDPARLGYADLRGYRVVHVTGSDIPDGYYMQLHTGPHEILKKEGLIYNTSTMEYTNHTIKFYLTKDGVRHRVKRTKGSILKPLREHRGELNRYIRDRRLDVRGDTENAIVEIVREYERLNDR